MSSCIAQDLDFCPELVELVSSGRTVGRSGRVFDKLSALSTPNNLMVLRQLMMKHRPQRTLEIGLCFGGSALVLAASHRDLNHRPDRQHNAIDPFQHSFWDGSGIANLERAGLSGWVDFHQAPSSLVLPRLVAEAGKFGLIYVDGSHLFEDVFVDAYFGIRLLDAGGLIAFDDSSDPHVAKVLQFFRRNFSSVLEELDLSDFRPPGIARIKYRLAHAMRRTQLSVFRFVGQTEREWNTPLSDF